MRRLLFLAVVWLVAFPAAAGAQQPAPDLDVRVERDASTQASFTELAVYHRITLIDKTTGQPPKAGFEVFAQAALVFPAFRRNLSPAALYRLERHLDLIVKLTFAATGVVIASGVYLMVNQTAYKTPFSKSAIDGVFALPFGKPYFVTLAVKLTIYALMVVASLPLIRGAQRNLRLYSEAVPAAPGLWSPKAGAAVAGGGGATAVRTAAPHRPAGGHPPPPAPSRTPLV